MAATRYRRFLKLCEEWPVDASKWGRDLGSHLRGRVAQAFREGENTQVANPEDCDQMYESLVRIHTNYHKNKYPRLNDTNFTGLTMEECRIVITTDNLKDVMEIKTSKWKNVWEKFKEKLPKRT
ncbi:ubiquinol-cytochrome-c reductase complex assembly factor 2 [Alligator mississippiensis]|uniref:Mitochondrial nucleoid factor 1 n=1 Tax=Alligator mississippiensis TaxID=8496 RepID=A0A151P4N0_ALLMI|nr:ubiquinol-cytochrome-c reductase complex assembly factor 2 [Alligator mississippiensis]KYO44008.1 ubiquinol-cytochrome-c reductase complex assembly factor 2 isoform A [Alligator mississippiensis]